MLTNMLYRKQLKQYFNLVEKNKVYANNIYF